MLVLFRWPPPPPPPDGFEIVCSCGQEWPIALGSSETPCAGVSFCSAEGGVTAKGTGLEGLIMIQGGQSQACHRGGPGSIPG